jgi:flagellar M-ring protein FliF
LVASAVDELRPENVTVIDADGNIPIVSRSRQPGVDRNELGEMEHSLSDKLISTLTPVVGSEGLRANVTIEYDLASSDSTQETYDPNGSVVLTSQVSEDRAGDVQAQGIPGTPSNVPGSSAQKAASTAAGNFPEIMGQRADHKTFAVSKTLRHAVQPPGGIKRLAAAVLVDYAVETHSEGARKVATRRRRSADEMKQIEDLAKAAIGFDPMRGDHISVQNISFAAIPSELPPANLPERLAPVVQSWMGVIRYAGLAALFCMVYFLILRPVKRQIIAALPARQPQLPARALEPDILATVGPRAPALKPKEKEGEVKDEDLLGEVTAVSAEVKKALALKRLLGERIKKDPETASRLIQNWVQQSEAQT